MMVVVIVVAETQPPAVGIPPPPPWIPGIIVPPRGIVIGRGIVVLPEMELFALYKRISVVHFAERSDVFPKKFTRHGNLATFAVNIRVQVTAHTNQEPPFGGACGFFSPVERSLKYFDEGGSVLLIGSFDNLPAPDDTLSFVGIRVFQDFPKGFTWVRRLPQILRNDMDAAGKENRQKKQKKGSKPILHALHLFSHQNFNPF
jgi:hypothetical protein